MRIRKAGRGFSLLLLTGLLLFVACRRGAQPQQLELDVFNPHTDAWADAPVTLRLENYAIVPAPYVRVYRQIGGTLSELPSQFDDFDLDGTPDQLFFLIDIGPNETTRLIIRPDSVLPSYAPRADAFVAVNRAGAVEEENDRRGGSAFQSVRHLALTADQNPDSNRIRFGGPVWESDLIGYRFHLDDAHLNDVFGKRESDLMLRAAAGDADSLKDRVVDVLRAGNSLSIGTPAVATRESYARVGNAQRTTVDVLADGPLRAVVRTRFEGVAIDDTLYNIVSEQEIHAGARWTEQRLRFEPELRQRQLISGLIRHTAAPSLKSGSMSGVFYMYAVGPQSAQGDPLALALLIPDRLRPKLQPSGQQNHLVQFASNAGAATYRYLAMWGREPDLNLAPEMVERYLAQVSEKWMQPLQLSTARR